MREVNRFLRKFKSKCEKRARHRSLSMFAVAQTSDDGHEIRTNNLQLFAVPVHAAMCYNWNIRIFHSIEMTSKKESRFFLPTIQSASIFYAHSSHELRLNCGRMEYGCAENQPPIVLESNTINSLNRNTDEMNNKRTKKRRG